MRTAPTDPQQAQAIFHPSVISLWDEQAQASIPTLQIQGLTPLAAGLFSLSTQAVPVGRHTPALAADLHRHNAWSVDADGHVTLSEMDSSGRVSKTIYDDGSFSETLYSIESRPIGRPDLTPPPSLSIAAGGSETVQIAQRFAADAPVATYRVYDTSGRLTDVWLPAALDANPASATYNTMVCPHWQYEYDKNGNQTSQTDPDGHTTHFAYDDLGRQTSRTLPGGQSESFTYNQRGQQATHTDFDGNIAAYSYLPAGDPHAGMLHQVTYAGAAGSGKATQTVTYTYDALGRPLTTTDASGATTNHYDAEGDLIEQDTPEGVIHYGYDLATGRHVETWTPSTDIAYGYDTQGRLTTVSVNELNGQTLASPLVTSYDYDAVGNKTRESLPDGELTNYSYDDLNRLTAVLATRGSTTLFSQQFVLNSNGTRHAVHETQRQADDSVETTDTTWAYDAGGRLTAEIVTSTAAGRSYANAFAYDLAGNRVGKIHTGDDGAQTTADSYNSNDELAQEIVTANGVSTSTAFTYDANGSLTTSVAGSQTTTYGYDARNKMASFVSGNTTAGYVYNDAGNRVAETVNGTTTLYLTDANNPTGYAQPIEERSSATSAPSVTYLVGDRVYAQIGSAPSTLRYLLSDGHGSTRALLDNNGIVISTLNYDAFGGAVGFSLNTAGTPFLFGGDAVYDPASGLYLHGDGVRGRSGFRFIEMDGQGYGSNSDPISLHKYLYANDDPAAYRDPSGRFSLGELAVVMGISSLVAHLGLQVAVHAGLDLSNTVVGKSLPDAAVIGVQGSSSAIGTALGRLVSYVPGLSWHIPQGVATAVAGVEFLFDIASAELAVFEYAGAGINSAQDPFSMTAYTGVVWNLWNADEYSKTFASVGLNRGNSGIGAFASPEVDRPFGVTFGRSVFGFGDGVAAFGGFTYSSCVNYQHFESMQPTIPMAIAWSQMSACLLGIANPAGWVAMDSVVSLWPYFKWKDSGSLLYRQTHSRYGQPL